MTIPWNWGTPFSDKTMIFVIPISVDEIHVKPNKIGVLNHVKSDIFSGTKPSNPEGVSESRVHTFYPLDNHHFYHLNAYSREYIHVLHCQTDLKNINIVGSRWCYT